jgi:hypothetical protein
VVGGVVVVDVVLDNAGFQISNTQKVELVMGADSASVQQIASFLFFYNKFNSMNLRQKSLPLDAPVRKKKRT